MLFSNNSYTTRVDFILQIVRIHVVFRIIQAVSCIGKLASSRIALYLYAEK